MIAWVLAAALALPLPVATPETAPPSREQVMAVPPQLKAQLQAEVTGPAHGDLDRLQRLVRFMGDGERGLGLLYREDATYTVGEGYLNRQANCVTYTLMFLALARLAGLEAYPQEIEETLSWQQLDDIVYRSNHVNARVRVGKQRYLVDVGGEFRGRPPSGQADIHAARTGPVLQQPGSGVAVRATVACRTGPCRDRPGTGSQAIPQPGAIPACCACATGTGPALRAPTPTR